MKATSIRLDEEQLQEIDAYAREKKIDRSLAVREILTVGLQHQKKKTALEKIRNRQWSIWKAAEYSEMTYRSFLELLRTENIPFPITKEDLANEFQAHRSEQ
ncbi:MAG: UPF0175 family protein [Candidatus Heimdallarchaeota archaeon]